MFQGGHDSGSRSHKGEVIREALGQNYGPPRGLNGGMEASSRMKRKRVAVKPGGADRVAEKKPPNLLAAIPHRTLLQEHMAVRQTTPSPPPSTR